MVMNPLLALTALHLHGRTGDPTLPLAVSRYLGRSLADHRAALQRHSDNDNDNDNDHDNKKDVLAEPVWLSAVLLSVLYWLLAHQRRPGEPYELPLPAWAMLHGVTTLYVRRRAVLGAMGYEWYGHRYAPLRIEDDDDDGDDGQVLSEKSRCRLDMLQNDLEILFARFGISDDADEQDEEQVAYQAARRHIVSYYRAYFAGMDERNLRLVICTMPVNVPPAFRRLLDRHDPLAMALVARLLVLLVPVESVWWMDGEGDYEVLHRDINGIRQLMPDELRWCMDWPCRVLSGEILLDR
ncbi:hypothetical protein PFICI_06776 [Pestalotiopsis fici W106-1]|uniref:Uncharacterized protein n=1 Tax=Pestalotiopsis fici (strain W106-1 / CGMCC3.15140) TaxID=1229662 RepID=W3X6X9_PESFW|nr:uncharacterized protein PFICI_06776 [Pestalotiopsis fici W106-1]ETS81774.1 hypothetical protein PFICI_06776 [Pestalotiopsis fici W106-1]